MVAFVDDPVTSIQQAALRSPIGSLLGTVKPSTPPNSKTRSSLAFALALSMPGKAPQLIGALQGIEFSQSREVDEEYEVEANSVGLPVDLIPQRLVTRTIQARRFDLYSQLMEEALGTREITTLTDQYLPLTLRELWRDPSGSFFTSITRAYIYTRVYLKDLGRHVGATDDLIVTTQASFVWRNRIRVI